MRDLVGDMALTLSGVGGCRTQPKGFVIIRVRVDEVSGYDEEQVALVVPDNSEFATRVPLILGTPALRRIINVMKESELDALSTPWATVRNSSALGQIRLNRVTLNPEITHRVTTTNKKDILDLDEVAYATKKIHLGPLESAKVHLHIKTQLQGYNANVCVSPLDQTDHLPVGVEVEDSYSVLRTCSEHVVAAVRNNSGDHVTIYPNQAVARVQLGNEEPQTFVSRRALMKLEPLVLPEDVNPTVRVSTGQVDSADPDDTTSPTETESSNTTQTGETTEPVTPKVPMTPEERKENLLSRLDLSGLDAWQPEEAQSAKELLKEFHDIFSLEKLEIGKTHVAEHEIKLTDTEPFKERFRRIPPPLVEEVRAHVKEMLDAGVIQPSNSPWSNAVVLVRKKDGSLRFCVDFRRLNQKTVQDAYQLPRITETLDLLQGMCCFSCLDLKSGFWQIPMARDSQAYTAFTVGNLGFFEWLAMPFGLTNAPATFQRAMEECMGDLNLKSCLVYLDDLITYSKNNPDHLERLRKVFERLRECGLKLKPEKCSLFQTEITYLGHKVNKDGITPSDANIEAIRNLKVPTTYTEIRSFVSCIGAYRRFIKNFAVIASPLYDHLKGDDAKKKKEKVTLTPEALEAVDALKLAATTAPVLIPADFTKPFRLETDASKKGLGAVLTQKVEQDKKYHPVAFGSSVLKRSQQNYHSSKLEFFALYWAITQRFKDYLRHGKPFLVRTDNNPLTYVMTTAKLDATGHRWVTELANYKFSLEYVKGSDNVVADCLSRNVPDPEEEDEEPKKPSVAPEMERVTQEGVKEMMDVHNLDYGQRSELYDPFVVQLRAQIESEGIVQAKFQGMEIVSRRARPTVKEQVTDWPKAQESDEVIFAVRRWIRRGKDRPLADVMGPTLAKTPEAKVFLQHQKWFKIQNNLLYHSTKLTARDSSKDPVELVDCAWAFVVPPQYRPDAIKGCHDDFGHQGRDRTVSLLKERFWWPGMVTEAHKRVSTCNRCRLYNAAAQTAPLRPIVATAALELLHVDFTSIEADPVDVMAQTKSINVLVMQDHFTKFTLLRVTPNQQAATVAHYLWNEWFTVVGIPRRLISDKGGGFTGDIIKEMCKLLEIDRITTTSFHPQGNGQVERMNQTIFQMIGKLSADKKAQWDLHLGAIQFAYNSTRSAITGYSPHFLMYYTIPMIPIDFKFPTYLSKPADIHKLVQRIDKYVAEKRCHMREAMKVASEQSKKEIERQVRYYDSNRKLPSAVIMVGDKVLLLANAYTGRRKCNDTWGSTVYEVVERMGGDSSPIYVIENELGHQQTVHRNRLYLLEPCNPLGQALAAHRANINLFTINPVILDVAQVKSIFAGQGEANTPLGTDPTVVRRGVDRYPAGWYTGKPKVSKWAVSRLPNVMDRTSGYIGSLTILTTVKEEG